MKKIIVLSFLLILNASAYAVTYCPQVITCDAQSCNGIPKDFHVSAGHPKANTTYYFSNAIDGSRIGLGDTVCAYGDVAISRKLLRADIDYPKNQWRPAMLEGIYICQYSADACPFKN